MSQQLTIAKQCPLPGFRIRHPRVSNGHPRVKPIGKIRNVSNEVDRCAFNTLERIFSEHWQRETEPRGSVNSGFGILQELFIRTKGSGMFESRKFDLLINQRDATVAATVIQWLGTNCGFGFLSGVLRECGYDLVDRKHLGTYYRFDSIMADVRLPGGWVAHLRDNATSFRKPPEVSQPQIPRRIDELHRRITKRGQDEARRARPGTEEWAKLDRQRIRDRCLEFARERREYVREQQVKVRSRLDQANGGPVHPPEDDDLPF